MKVKKNTLKPILVFKFSNLILPVFAGDTTLLQKIVLAIKRLRKEMEQRILYYFSNVQYSNRNKTITVILAQILAESLGNFFKSVVKKPTKYPRK